MATTKSKCQILSLILCSVLVIKGAAQTADEIQETHIRAVALSEARQNKQSIELMESIREGMQLHFGHDSKEYSLLLRNLAVVYANQRDLQTAISLFQEREQILLRLELENTEDYIETLWNLGNYSFHAGDYARSEEKLLKLLKHSQQVNGRDTVHANYLNGVAGFYYNVGRYDQAEGYLAAALDIFRTHLDPKSPALAIQINNLGHFMVLNGKPEKAEPLIREAMGINKEFPHKKMDYASNLNNLGNICMDLKRYTEAESYLKDALRLRVELFGQSDESVAEVLNNLGNLAMERNHYADVLEFLEGALKIYAKTAGKESEQYATTLNNLGILHNNLGQHKKSEPMLVEALKLMETFKGRQHPDYWNTQHNLASVYFSTKEVEKGAALYKAVVAQKLHEIQVYFPTLSEKEKQLFYSRINTFLDLYRSFCLEYYKQKPELLIDLFNLTLSTKGILLDDSKKVRDNILNSGNSFLINLYKQWQEKKDYLAQVYALPLTEKEELIVDENALEAEIQQIEKELSGHSALLNAKMNRPAFDWKSVQQKLKEGEAAIEILSGSRKVSNQSYKLQVSKKIGSKLTTGQTVDQYADVYMALITTFHTKDKPHLVVLENGAELNGRYLRYYRNAIRNKITDENSFNQYWKPLSIHLSGVKKVYLAADGVYHQINLNTLFNLTTGKYVFDEVDVQVITNTKDLLAGIKPLERVKDVALFGYPDYNQNSLDKLTEPFALLPDVNADSAQRFFSNGTITDLPGTKKEVESIAASLATYKIKYSSFLKERASEAAVKKILNPQVLHIATHGFFLANLPRPAPQASGFGAMDTSVILENPLLRSGLLFTGAKKAFTGGGTHEGEDGVLTAFEAMNLNLDKTDLVVLSACETGLGVTANGEGVYGLQRAFQVAGAKAVLMSLWTVSDDATQMLMTYFYQGLLATNEPHAAFRQAQARLRETHPQPFYWGAFVLTGQ